MKTNPFLLNIDLESSKKDVRTYIGFGWIALAGGGVPTKKRERMASTVGALLVPFIELR